MSNCAFCEIAYGAAPAQVVYDGISTLGIVPLNPVTDGHVIFMPRKHVRDALDDGGAFAQVMTDTATFVNMARMSREEYRSVNIITSVGAPATQTIFHLHVHVVPRREGDGLRLPWTGQGEAG